jgi:hypothetical protein
MSVPPPASSRLSISQLVARRDMSRDETYAMQHELNNFEIALKALRREHKQKIHGLNFKYENEVKKKKKKQNKKSKTKQQSLTI